MIERMMLAVVATAVLGACTASPDEVVAPSVAIVADQTLPDERDIVAPSVLAARMAIREAGLEALHASPESAAALAGDPSVVGVVVAPFTTIAPATWAAWAQGGLPVMSLDALAPAGPGVRQFVPSVETTAGAMREAGAVEGTCVLAAGDAWSASYAAALLEAEPTWRPAADTGGCPVSIWSGPAGSAPAPGEPLILTDRARTNGYLRRDGPAAGTPLGSCGCVDPTSDPDPTLQSFVHRYQAESGLDPGPYAAEAYDATNLLLSAVRQVGPDRSAIAAALTATSVFEGVTGSYRWDRESLVEPGPQTYAAEGWRWLPA